MKVLHRSIPANISAYLFLLSLLISVQSEGSKNPYEYYINTIAEPYLNAYKSFQARVQQQREELYKYMNILGGNYNKLDSVAAYDRAIEKDLSIEKELSFISKPPSSQARILGVDNCYAGGVLVNTTRMLYTCDGENVTKSEYTDQGGAGNPDCSSQKINDTACYCPFDYYGPRCENFIGATCEAEQLNYLNDCEEQSSYAYTYGYGGIAPCYIVGIGDTLELRFKFTCNPQNEEWAYEGIKRDDAEFDPVPPPTNFTYPFDGPNLKLGFTVDNATLGVDFINFKALSIPTSFNATVSNSQLEGIGEVRVPIMFTEEMRNEIAVAGRYYYEISLYAYTYNVLSKGRIGAFEVAGYEEPGPKSKTNLTALIITLVVIGVILLAILYYFFIYKKRKMEQRLLQGMVVEEIADEIE